jgi:copper chaperone CopZ
VERLMATAEVTAAIHGLTCGGGGALTLERALGRIPGVVRVYVSPATEVAYIEYDPERVAWKDLEAVVRACGLRAELLGIRAGK